MSPSLVRRLIRNAQGQLVEAEVTEAAPGETGFVGDQPAPGYDRDASPVPRYRPYRPQIAPPPPSAAYRASPGYAAGGTLAVRGDTIRRASDNYRAWQNHYSQATNTVTAWLAADGHLGADTQTAYLASQRAAHAKHQARQAVADAKAAANQAAEQLAADVGAHLESGKGALPDGSTVTAAKQRVEGLELVVAQVDEAASTINQRWGQALRRADWTAALAQTEAVKGDQAEQATAWLRAKLSPPPSSSADPIGWAGL